MKLTIEQIAQNHVYLPRQLSQLIKQKNAYQFTNFDIAVIRLLVNGTRQKDNTTELQQCRMPTSGEKRLNYRREEFECTNNEQLVAFAKTKGLFKRLPPFKFIECFADKCIHLDCCPAPKIQSSFTGSRKKSKIHFPIFGNIRGKAQHEKLLRILPNTAKRRQ